MITVSVSIDHADYDTMIDRYLPMMAEQLRASGNPIGMLLSNGMPAEMAKKILHGLTQAQKEQLLVDLINGNSDKICAKVEKLTTQQGISADFVQLCAAANH